MLNSIDKRHKRLLALDREIDALRNSPEAASLIPFPEPVHIGYEMTFALRDDIARRADAHVYRHILDEINASARCRTRSFSEKVRKGIYRSLAPELKFVAPERYFEVLCHLPGQLGAAYRKRFTYREIVLYRRSFPTLRVGYAFDQPWAFVKTVEPTFQTHTKRLNRSHYRRLAELEAEFKALGGYRALIKLTRGGAYYPSRYDRTEDRREAARRRDHRQGRDHME